MQTELLIAGVLALKTHPILFARVQGLPGVGIQRGDLVLEAFVFYQIFLAK